MPSAIPSRRFMGSLKSRFTLVLLALAVVSLGPWLLFYQLEKQLTGLNHRIELTGSLRYRLLDLRLAHEAGAPTGELEKRMLAQREVVLRLRKGDNHRLPPCEEHNSCRALNRHQDFLEQTLWPLLSLPAGTVQARKIFKTELRQLDNEVRELTQRSEHELRKALWLGRGVAGGGLVLTLVIAGGIWDVFRRIRSLESSAHRSSNEELFASTGTGRDEVASLARALATAMKEARRLSAAETHRQMASTLAMMSSLDEGVAELSSEFDRLVPHGCFVLELYENEEDIAECWSVKSGQVRYSVLTPDLPPPSEDPRRTSSTSGFPCELADLEEISLELESRAGPIGRVRLRRKAPEFSSAELELARSVTPSVATAVERMRFQSRLQVAQQIDAFGGASRMLAHEIRNPMNGMTLHAQLIHRKLKRLGITAKEREGVEVHLEVIGSEIKRLDDLIKNHLAAGKNLAFERADINRLIEEVIEVHRPAAAEQGISIHFSAPAPIELEIDPAKITQVLHNLIRNAIESMYESETRKLTIELRKGSTRVSVLIEDTGSGIQDHEAIFLPGTTTKSWGTGMGLPLSRQIVRIHKGSLTARSRSVTGSRFELSLPLPDSTPMDKE